MRAIVPNGFHRRSPDNVSSVKNGSPAKRLILASASPARLNLLVHAGIDPTVVVSSVDESQVDSSDPAEVAGTLAGLKAAAVAAVSETGDLVLGCDSVLGFDGQVLGKPTDAADASARWKAMRGRSGVLHTGHCLIDLHTTRRAQRTTSTVVHFADIDDDEIAAYVATGEPLNVAGAFTIDGICAPFIERLEGDHGTVVGLSLPTLRHLLAQLDLRITDLWHPLTT
jgi:septum formation protein